MPTKRKKRTREQRQQITPETVALFQEITSMREDDDRRPDLVVQLHRALGMKPWHYCPLYTSADELDDDNLSADMKSRIRAALELRQQLEDACREYK